MGFTIRHLGISKVRGRFAGFDADVVVGETLATTTVTATIDLASVDTGNADRDAHVLQPDCLDVERRPTMTFRSTGIRAAIDGDGGGWHLDGELTIGDVTRPMTLAVELGGIEDSPMGGPRHAGFEATGEIRRTDFGIAPALPARRASATSSRSSSTSSSSNPDRSGLWISRRTNRSRAQNGGLAAAGRRVGCNFGGGPGVCSPCDGWAPRLHRPTRAEGPWGARAWRRRTSGCGRRWCGWRTW